MYKIIVKLKVCRNFYLEALSKESGKFNTYYKTSFISRIVNSDIIIG